MPGLRSCMARKSLLCCRCAHPLSSSPVVADRSRNWLRWTFASVYVVDPFQRLKVGWISMKTTCSLRRTGFYADDHGGLPLPGHPVARAPFREGLLPRPATSCSASHGALVCPLREWHCGISSRSDSHHTAACDKCNGRLPVCGSGVSQLRTFVALCSSL